ncbi:TetR/AcrR family transcriptional regulator [Micromonospora sp. PPF5-17]|uniref:TetR family transcriptional regulator n=1 Tax=Micromonospora solifontis TaxID=2487138 RepID=A0ABX9W8Y5_9ACTN|nr:MULTISPECIES: TetR/AcrR family transcriptional regulator [Micromonospora]NES39488.1 TetR/AcrR family transcriptional regulator [Micromonospora solifontis]NES59033.1 TetR/AcrR family transcriptional regulator [Micromonospora sp. PPF5-6]RNL88648.1 TetR family transcriptional regulator [Micromonospora solifontis]
MPRTADHAERRSQLIAALVRVAARDGLHAVTMRSVAAEAGVSLRLVQYYFDTKAQLVHAALRHLEAQSNQRWAARLADQPDPVEPRVVVEAFLAEALPTDEPSRVFHTVWTSYAVLAMTDPDLAAQPFVDGPNHLEAQLAQLLRRAQDQGRIPADRNPAIEAARLLMVTHGLGTSILVGRHTPDAAQAVLRYHLDRLFPPA